MNPPIVINKHAVKKLDGSIIHINVIRDDLLAGGTKQRALIKFIEYYNNYEEFVYVGPASGFAQIALTIVCMKLCKQVTLFILNSPNYDPYLSLICEKLGAKITIFYEKMSDVKEKALSYVKYKSKVMLIPFGLNSEIYNEFLLEQLSDAIPAHIVPKRLWMAVGSGTIIRALGRIWLQTEFMPVQVGKHLLQEHYTEDLWYRLGGQERINKLMAPQRFFEPVSNNLLPPYPSANNYDAKVWQHILKYGQNDDYIWNVAAENEILKYNY